MGKVFLSPEVLREKYNWVLLIVGESRNRVSAANYQLNEALKRMGIFLEETTSTQPQAQLTPKVDYQPEPKKPQPRQTAEVVSSAQRLAEVRQRINSLYKQSEAKQEDNDQ